MAQKTHGITIAVGGKSVTLDREQARSAAYQILQELATSGPVRRSAAFATSAAKQAALIPAKSAGAGQKVASTKVSATFEGKSSWQNPHWKQRAFDLAKIRAKRKFESYMRRLQFEGKDISNYKATGQHVADDHGNVTYTIQLVLG